MEDGLVITRKEAAECPHCGVTYSAEKKNIPVDADKDGSWGIQQSLCPRCNGMTLVLIPMRKAVTPSPRGLANRSTDEIIAELSKKPEEDPRQPTRLWPRSSAPVLAKEVPEEYARLFREAWDVLATSPRSSAALGRRCLQQLIHREANIRKRDLLAEIEELVRTGGLPTHLSDQLDLIRSKGNFAAHPKEHRVTGEIIDVTLQEAKENLDTLEALFDFYFVLPARHKDRKEKWAAKASAAKRERQ